MSRRKKITTAVALLAIAILLLSGTFAWIDQFQHKTNEAEGAGSNKYNAVLIEDFEEINNWKVTDTPKKKEARVKNLGADSDTFGDVYVRLQLKEYLEMMDLTYDYSDERLAVDTSGNFIKIKDDESSPGNPDATDLAAVMAAHPDYNDGRSLVPYTNIKDGKDYHYIPTKEKDINGQFGKFLITDVTEGTATPLIAGATRHSDDASLLHNDDGNGECTYETVTWNQAGNDSAKFREYVELKLGDNTSDIIFFSDWVTAGEKPVAKWILDDTPAPDGTFWAYWGGPIAPGDETANLLKTVDLIKQPTGKMYYAMHVDMEAASIDDIDTWTDAPPEILDMHNSLANAKIQVVPDPDPTVRTVMQGDTQDFNEILTDPDSLLGSVTWEVVGSQSPTNGTSIDANGTLRVATDEPKDTVLTVKARSVLVPVKVGTAKVKVIESQIKTLPTPDSTITVVNQGAIQVFTASIPGDPTATFTNWTVTGSMGLAGGTSISPTTGTTGTLTIDADEPVGNKLTITAQKVGDLSKPCISYTVTVEEASIVLTGDTTDYEHGTATTRTFTASIPENAGATFTWALTGQGTSTLTGSGSTRTLNIPAAETGPRTLTIKVTSTSLPGKEAVVSINIACSHTGASMDISDLTTSTPEGTVFWADGMAWILLKHDGSGNALIVSRYLAGSTKFKASGNYAPGYNDATCLLRDAMRNFYNGLPTGGDLKSRAQKVLTPNGGTAFTDTGAGSLTTVNASGEQTAFALSTADFNTGTWPTSPENMKIGKDSCTGAAAGWWLRSPVTSASNAQYVGTSGAVNSSSNVVNSYDVRPALMINLTP